jgi:hypothetical protein
VVEMRVHARAAGLVRVLKCLATALEGVLARSITVDVTQQAAL